MFIKVGVIMMFEVFLNKDGFVGFFVRFGEKFCDECKG